MDFIELLGRHIIAVWFFVGALLILLEGLTIPGIGFLFAGISAITTGALIEFHIISSDQYISQWATFLVGSFVWAGILWVPMQGLHKKNKSNSYSNMIGDTAKVHNQLQKNVTGEVKWSGTIMQALLDNSSDIEVLKDGDLVKIVEVKGNTLMVVPK